MNAPNETSLEIEISIPGVTNNLYVIGRLWRWSIYVRWMEYSGLQDSRPKAVRSWWYPVVMRGKVSEQWHDPLDVCPMDPQECRETEEAIRRLPVSLRDAVVQEYLVGGKQFEKAAALGIDQSTFYRRCQKAHSLLLGLMQDVLVDMPDEEYSEKYR